MLEFLAQSEPVGWQQTVDKLARTPLSQIIVLVAVCTVIRLAMMKYLADRPVHLRFGPYKVAKFINEFLDAIVYAGVFVFLVVRPFALQTFTIPSESMIDTLLVNDFIVANKAVYRYSRPQHGDIVVFRPPVYACRPEQLGPNGEVNADFIKRCVGVPGDIVEVRNGTLYRNGQAMNEPYLKDKPGWDFKLVNVKGVVKDNPTGLELWPLAIVPDSGSLSGYRINEPNRAPIASPFFVNDQETMDKLLKLPAAAIPPKHYLFMGDNRPGSFDGRGWGLIHEDDIIGRAEFIWMPIKRIRNLR